MEFRVEGLSEFRGLGFQGSGFQGLGVWGSGVEGFLRVSDRGLRLVPPSHMTVLRLLVGTLKPKM